LTPANAMPPMFVPASLSNVMQQPLSPHHPQMGTISAACLPVSGAVLQQPLSTLGHHALASNEFYLSSAGVREDQGDVAACTSSQTRHYAGNVNNSHANQPHFTYQNSAAATAASGGHPIMNS